MHWNKTPVGKIELRWIGSIGTLICAWPKEWSVTWDGPNKNSMLTVISLEPCWQINWNPLPPGNPPSLSEPDSKFERVDPTWILAPLVERYSSPKNMPHLNLTSFLNETPLPSLKPAHRDALGADITEREWDRLSKTLNPINALAQRGLQLFFY